ncbi:MAG: GldG family protein [Anaerolineales bacterium]
MNLERSRLATICFWLAPVVLLLTGGWYIVQRQFDTITQVGLGLAIVLLAAAVLLDPERVRRALTGRQARFGSNALLLSIAVIGILAVVNYLAAQNPQSWDVTEDQQYSLSPESKSLVESLKAPVQVKGFYTPNLSRARDNLKPLLDQYQIISSGNFSYEFVDPNNNPLVADQYGVTRDGSLVVVQDDRSEVLTTPSERSISSAIIRVTQGNPKIVYFLTGHGERDLEEGSQGGYTTAQSGLESKNYEVKTLNLLSEGSVPDDADAVVVAAPQKPLSLDEINALSDYLASGGSLLVMFEPSITSGLAIAEDPLATYLQSSWAVEAHDDVIVDLVSQRGFDAISSNYGSHPITSEMGNLATAFPGSLSLSTQQSADDAINDLPLVMTGQNSWGETDLETVKSGQGLAFDEGSDLPGPLSVAIAATNSSEGARVVVYGDSDFATNAYYSQLGNGDLFLNSVDWLAHQEELIQLTPKQQTQRIVTPPTVQAIGLILLLAVIVIPGGVVGVGVSVWWRRRQHSGWSGES